MVDGMKHSRQSLVVSREWGRVRFLFSVASFLLPVFCCAEELVDPTRPPVSVSAPVDESAPVEAKTEPGLQSIIIAKNRRAAIIDGQTVELGGRVGEARLIEVNAMNVVLKTRNGRQVLMLFPDVIISKTKNDAPPVQTDKKVSNGDKK